MGENEIEFHLVELQHSLYHLAVNDNIKKEIYEKYSMRECAKSIILKGNEVEKEYTLKLLYQLCFDDEVAKNIAKNLENDLKALIKDPNLKRKNIKKYCKGIFWMTRDEETRNSSKLALTKINQEPTALKHLMISYNRDSRDLCLSIKSELEKLGYKIWIDIEDIHGSSLESMANAIEQSACVLMCMTEKYKLSSNCRLEAEYTITLNKPIIPLILQKDYKPDGWLGIILGSKMFINFRKYDFKECMRRLKNEVENIYKKNESQDLKPINSTNQTSHEANISMISHDKPVNSINDKLLWSESDVNKWLESKNFQPNIIENIRPCDGKIIYQLYSILKNAPEFFYTAIRSDSNNKVVLRDIALFTYELNALFEH